jgi:predicted GNAT family acetyltransferase
MNLHHFILEEVKKSTKNKKMQSTLSALTLLQVTQQPLYKDTYCNLSVAQINDEGKEITVMFLPEQNKISGLTNGRLSRHIFPVIDDDVDNFYNGDDYSFKLAHTFFIKEEIIDRIKDFKTIIEKSKNFKQLKKELEKKSTENPEFLHSIKQYLFDQNQYTVNDFEDFQGILQSIVQMPEKDKTNSKLKSEMYYKNTNEDIQADSFVFRDAFNFSIGYELLYKNSLEARNHIKSDELSSYDLRGLYQDDKLDCVPEDIMTMISEEKRPKEIYKAFKKNYKSKKLDAVLSFGSRESRLFKVMDLFFDKYKKDVVQKTANSLEHFQSLEKYQALHKNDTQKILNKVIEQFNEFQENPEIKYSQSNESAQAEGYYAKVANCYEIIQKESQLKIFPEYNLDYPLKGLNYVSYDAFKESNIHDRQYFLAKTQNELIGKLSTYNDSKNYLHIGSACVATHHRQKGVMTQLYTEMAQYAVKNDLPIVNSHYTDDGGNYLPQMKKKLMEKYPKLLFIDKDVRRGRTDLEAEIASFNDSFVRMIHNRPDKLKLATLTPLYNKYKAQYIEEHNKLKEEDGYIKKYELKERILSNFNEDFTRLNMKRKIQKI